MAFEIQKGRKAKVREMGVLGEKDRKEGDKPGFKLDLEIVLPNSDLDMFDPALRRLLYTKTPGTPVLAAKKQQGLPEVEVAADLPNLSSVGNHLPSIKWVEEQTGKILTLVWGNSPYRREDCKAYAFRFKVKEGGSVLTNFSIDVPNVPEKMAGILPQMKGLKVDIILEQGEIKQDELPDMTPEQRANTPPAGAAPAPAPAGEPLSPEEAFLATQRQALRDEKAAPKGAKVTTKPAGKSRKATVAA